ncbi:Rho GTPase activation protein [Phlyctochytrium arcticum]|nr:Rho GTPase activation protein [Phlyctochytrium arcticum]
MTTSFTSSIPAVGDHALHDLVNTSIIREAGLDWESKPILAVYACYLPDPKAVNYDTLLSIILARLDEFVENDYVIVFFSGGASYKPGWGWMIQAYKNLSRKYRKNLKNLYVVHPSLWPKLVIQTMATVVSPKFSRKVIWVYNLAVLGQHLPLKQIHIPDQVYRVDMQYMSKGTQSSVVAPAPITDGSRVFGAESIEVLMGPDGELGVPRVVTECIEFILQNGMDAEGIFRRSPASRALTTAKEKYDRNEPNINLEELGGVHLASVLLKTFCRNLQKPLFEFSLYDTLRGISTHATEKEQIKYIRDTVFPSVSRATVLLLREILLLLNKVQQNSGTNLMTSNNLVIVWAPNLVRSDNPMVDMNICATGREGALGTVLKVGIEKWASVFDGILPATGNIASIPSSVNTPAIGHVAESGTFGNNTAIVGVPETRTVADAITTSLENINLGSDSTAI